MATDEFGSFWYSDEYSWGRTERDLWNAFDTFGITNDPVAQALFHEGYFVAGVRDADEIVAIRETLADYLSTEYGIDFESEFDWDTWREMYED